MQRRRVQIVSANGQVEDVYVYDALGQLVAEYNNLLRVRQSETSYLTSDTLGTPRVVTKADGSVKSRHDYLPFGEEIGSQSGGRSTVPAYGTNDQINQKFSGKQRDGETGLDYFLVRYYSPAQGRFTSPDEFKGGPEELFGEVDPHDPLFYAEIAEPQSLNKYQYCLNNPLRYIDPDGHQTEVADTIKTAATAGTAAALSDATPIIIESAAGAIGGPAAITAIAGVGSGILIVGEIRSWPSSPPQDGRSAAINGNYNSSYLPPPGGGNAATNSSASPQLARRNASRNDKNRREARDKEQEKEPKNTGKPRDKKGKKKDRSLDGVSQQEEEMQAYRDKTIKQGGYPITQGKTPQNRKNATKRIRSSEDVKP